NMATVAPRSRGVICINLLDLRALTTSRKRSRAIAAMAVTQNGLSPLLPTVIIDAYEKGIAALSTQTRLRGCTIRLRLMASRNARPIGVMSTGMILWGRGKGMDSSTILIDAGIRVPIVECRVRVDDLGGALHTEEVVVRVP